jgi:hypothetical protein
VRDVPGSNEGGVAEGEADYFCDFGDGTSGDGGEDFVLETGALLFQVIRGNVRWQLRSQEEGRVT